MNSPVLSDQAQADYPGREKARKTREECDRRARQLVEQVRVAKAKWQKHMRAVDYLHDHLLMGCARLPSSADEPEQGADEEDFGDEQGQEPDEDEGPPNAAHKEIPTHSRASERLQQLSRKEASNENENKTVPPSISMKRDLIEKERALRRAEEQHNQHRFTYGRQFWEHVKSRDCGAGVDLAEEFGPIFVQRGQELIRAFKNAEAEYEEAVAQAEEAGVHPSEEEEEEEAKRQTNIYLDNEELAAMVIGKQEDRIHAWSMNPVTLSRPPSPVADANNLDTGNSKISYAEINNPAPFNQTGSKGENPPAVGNERAETPVLDNNGASMRAERKRATSACSDAIEHTPPSAVDISTKGSNDASMKHNAEPNSAENVPKPISAGPISGRTPIGKHDDAPDLEKEFRLPTESGKIEQLGLHPPHVETHDENEKDRSQEHDVSAPSIPGNLVGGHPEKCSSSEEPKPKKQLQPRRPIDLREGKALSTGVPSEHDTDDKAKRDQDGTSEPSKGLEAGIPDKGDEASGHVKDHVDALVDQQNPRDHTLDLQESVTNTKKREGQPSSSDTTAPNEENALPPEDPSKRADSKCPNEDHHVAQNEDAAPHRSIGSQEAPIDQNEDPGLGKPSSPLVSSHHGTTPDDGVESCHLPPSTSEKHNEELSPDDMEWDSIGSPLSSSPPAPVIGKRKRDSAEEGPGSFGVFVSRSVVAEGSKRRMIDDWARKMRGGHY